MTERHIKLWLDDYRPAPTGWEATANPYIAMALIASGDVLEVSLDHDLEFYERDQYGLLDTSREVTGYDVLCFIEKLVHDDPDFVPPVIHIHTDNGAARRKMELGVKSIARAYQHNEAKRVDGINGIND